MSAIKKHKKLIFLLILFIPFIIFILPVMELIIKMIFTIGNYVGTIIRQIAEGKVC